MKVLVVDDNPIIRLGLRASLELLPDVDVVEEAENGAVAVERVARGDVDVVLLDVRMPVRDGLSALPDLVPHATVLMLTHTDEMETVAEAMQAGASGYILHGSLEPEEIGLAIRTCRAGGRVTFGFEPWAVAAAAPSAEAPLPAAGHGLSMREAEIMGLVAQGLTNAQIARRLFLSEKTVKNHINRIFAKLDVDNRGQAIASWLGTCAGPEGPGGNGPALGLGPVVTRRGAP